MTGLRRNHSQDALWLIVNGRKLNDTILHGNTTVGKTAVTEYRADLLIDEIAERIGEIAGDISEAFGVKIQNVNGGSDHVHILFTAKPTTDLTKFINSLKGVTSRKIRDENPEVRQALDKAFWQPDYFLATTGQMSIDVLMKYVEEQ